MAQKLCMFCTHYDWEAPYEYSEHTAGGGYTTCFKGHSDAHWSGNSGTIEEFRTAILTAENCPDYDEAKP